MRKTILIIIILLIVPTTSFAVTKMYFEPQSLSAGVGGNFEVAVNLNTTDEINAVSASIIVPSSFKYIGYNDGNSILSIFVDKPKFDDKKQTVDFSGLIPGGFRGSGKLIILNFSPNFSTNNSVFKFNKDESYALLNSADPKRGEISLSDLLIPVDANATNTLKRVEDKNPPETFRPIISNDINLFNGEPFIVFNAVDKVSGINHYEISITSKKDLYNWVNAESPYKIESKDLGKYIYIKAVDNDGNERIIMLDNDITTDVWHSGYFIAIILLTIIVILIFVSYFSRKKRK